MAKEAAPRTIRLRDYEPPAWRTEETELEFDLREGTTEVRSRLRVRRTARGAPDTPLVLDGEHLELLAVTIDGRPLSGNEFRLTERSLELFDLPEHCEIAIVTRIEPERNTALEGLYKSGAMYCTQCEAEGFRRITYYQDRPDVLAKFTTTIVADAERFPVLLSNGNLVAESEADGRRRVTWHDPFPKPSYLFALVAGDLALMTDSFTTASGRELELRIYSEPHNIGQCEFAMGALKRAMRWDERRFGREYDLDIYMIVAVEDFNMGAMENKGLNIFNTACVLASPDTAVDAAYQRVEAIIAHEYFHNWSGNRVTCRDWFQLSLKEGFTVFRDAEFTADSHSRTVKRIEDVANLRARQFAEDSGPMAHPVRPDSYIEIANFYTATVYEKGAEVVGMIRTLVGDDGFRKGTDLYFERHDGQAATTEDFVVAMEEANGIDLKQFRRWYTQAGTPTLAVHTSWNGAASELTLTIKQSCPATPGQPDKVPLHLPVLIGLVGVHGDDGGDARWRVRGDAQWEWRGSSLLVHVRDAVTELALARIAHQPPAAGTGTLEREAASLAWQSVGEICEPADGASEPSLSFLRGFSAPVRVDFPRPARTLAFLARHDTDGFARWDALQSLLQDALSTLRKGLQTTRSEVATDPGATAGRALSHLGQELLDAFAGMLAEALAATDPEQKLLLSQMLALPSEEYLFEQAETVDVEGICAARDALRTAIAVPLRDAWLELYETNAAVGPYVADAAGMARRGVRNLALGYLAVALGEQAHGLIARHLEIADNLSDRLAALRQLADSGTHPARAELLAAFHDRWQHASLVVNQWLQVQAASPQTDLRAVALLEKHPAFDARNPNKLRSLYGVFSLSNNRNFHAADGSGYDFLAQRIIERDAENPQVAARLATPLTRWRKFDPGRQRLMQAALRRIHAVADTPAGLSKDLFEVVSKSLAGV